MLSAGFLSYVIDHNPEHSWMIDPWQGERPPWLRVDIMIASHNIVAVRWKEMGGFEIHLMEVRRDTWPLGFQHGMQGIEGVFSKMSSLGEAALCKGGNSELAISMGSAHRPTLLPTFLYLKDTLLLLQRWIHQG